MKNVGRTKHPLHLKKNQIDFYPKALESPSQVLKTSLSPGSSKKKVFFCVQKLDLAHQNNAIAKAEEIEKARKFVVEPCESKEK